MVLRRVLRRPPVVGWRLRLGQSVEQSVDIKLGLTRNTKNASH